MDATPWGRLLGAAREDAGLTWNAAADLARINFETWKANELGYWTIDGRKVAAKRGRPFTIARMALVVGVTPEELRAAGRSDAATNLELMLGAHAKTPDLTVFHERWLRAKRQEFPTTGAFLEYVLSVAD
jgi:hypothetical protein